MASIASHGGHCCGMKHIHTFRDTPEENVRSLIERTGTPQWGDGRYQLEVILSDRQTRDNPDLIAELARLGYVYTSSWTGQHGTPIHLFLRAKQRLALSASNFYNRWVNDLNGMLPHPALAGQLPALVENFRPDPNRRFTRGDRVVNVGPRSQRLGQEGTVIFADDFEVQVRYDQDRRVVTFGAATELLALVGANLAAPQEPAAPRVYRHPTNPPFLAPEQPAPRRLILSQFYCIFAETGRESRVFGTLLEGREAYPRARNWQERKIYSDGEVVEGPVQHG